MQETDSKYEFLEEIELLVTSNLTGDKREAYLDSLNSIKEKLHTKNLNLAVIGEFSSGKSTLVNALLGERLLPEAVMPTTAAATYLHKVEGNSFYDGGASHLEVAFFDGCSFTVNEKHIDEIKCYLSETYSVSFEGFKELVAILTSTQNVARNIVELSISLPSIKIPLEITVIDTPGFNPGEDNVDNHLEITSHVVEHVADLALVLIPAKMAMSNTLRNFLSDKLNPYLHRCVFIITKSDEISLNDREPLMDFVKGVLSTIGVCNPQVMMVSARTALPVKKIPASMAEEWAYWSDDFSRNEEVLWRKLRDSAQIVIEEHAYRLLKKLIIDIEESLDLLKSQLTRTAEILEQNQICRIEHMTSAILDKESSFLRGVAKSLDISSNSYLDNSLAFSRVLINQGKSLSDYDKVQAPRIQSYVSSTTQKYISACKDKFQILDNCAVKSICNFKKEFESHYRDMPALAPEFSSMGVAAQFATTRFESGNESKIASDEQLSQQGLKMGAFAGSAIGTFILPGVGTIIGGLIGGALGGLGFTRSEKEIQEKVFNSLRSSLQKHFNERKAFINLKLEQRVNQHLALLNKYCLEHIHAYKENVNTLIESQNKQKMQLERHLQQSTASLEAIKDYNKLLSEQLQQLKKHN